MSLNYVFNVSVYLGSLDQQLLELLEREAVSFLVKYINEVSIRDFFEIFGHGVNLLMRKAMRINHL